VASYWLLDPDDAGALEVLELGDDGRYRTVAEVVGDETVEQERPFLVSVSPAACWRASAALRRVPAPAGASVHRGGRWSGQAPSCRDDIMSIIGSSW
jgi:hypothetical protein